MGNRVLAERYELIEKIGEGGMAVVFKCKDRLLDRFVAVKILRPEYIKDESFIESFRRESQLVAGIVDPNIVTVYDVGQQGNVHYIVMELVEGETLSEIIKREEKLDAKRTVSYGRQIAMALATAHKNHLIHRDIKPHNIMVTNDGVAKLMDFGIAKRVTNDTLVGDEKEAVMGSIHYFSPEQARGMKVDERSDIYSLGIVMYEMITGKVPYDGDNAVEVAVKHMNEPMVPPSRFVPDMPQDLEDIIMKATSKSADRRYNNAEEMITDLNFVKFSRPSDFSLGLVKDEEEVVETSFDDVDETEEENNDSEDVKIYNTSSNKKAKKSKEKKSFNWAIVIAAVLAIAIAIPVSGLIAKKITGKEASVLVNVPHLEDLSYDEAAAKLDEMGLGITIDQEIVNDAKEAGTVLSYSPSEGTEIKKGQTVKVNISKKSSGRTVPSLYMLEKSSAKTKIEQFGYKLGSVTEAFDDEVPVGYVISSNPGSGVSLESGQKVNIVVSKGKDPENATSFNLKSMKGMTEEEAVAYIEENHCTAVIKKGANASVAKGSVYLQSPQAGNEVAFESEITIYVNNMSSGSSDEELNIININLDYSLAETDDFNISIVVQYEGKTESQYVNVPASKSQDGESFQINGKGIGKAIVTYGNRRVYEFALDFTNETYTTTFVYSGSN